MIRTAVTTLHTDYSSNVFINCPFDSEYQPIFEAIVFAIQACGFIARCAKESNDTNDIRIGKILALVNESKYAIHDLSRVEYSTSVLGDEQLPRFNMPLELGIFLGCMTFGVSHHKTKQYLILEKEAFRFKKFLSDLSGQDIKYHNNTPEKALGEVRDWLSSKAKQTIPSRSPLTAKYHAFRAELPLLCKPANWLPDELTFPEYTELVYNWLQRESLREL
jgi:hypothetical protein